MTHSASLERAALPQRLRDGTWDLHRQVERQGAMGALLRSALDAPSYRAYLRNLHALYAALETALAHHAAHPMLAPLALPGLARAAALAADLATLPAPDAEPPLCAATQAYVARLQGLDAHAPGRLAAHAYVRYLGDLNGGQVLARIVAASPLLPAGVGTAFYRFGTPEQVAQRLRALREGLAALPADEAEVQALVAEARWAFAQHGRLFDELPYPGSPPKPLSRS